METVGTVIGGDVEMISDQGTHLLFEYHQIFGLRSLHNIRNDALLLEPLDLRIDRCRTDAAGDKENVHFLKFFRRLVG